MTLLLSLVWLRRVVLNFMYQYWILVIYTTSCVIKPFLLFKGRSLHTLFICGSCVSILLMAWRYIKVQSFVCKSIELKFPSHFATAWQRSLRDWYVVSSSSLWGYIVEGVALHQRTTHSRLVISPTQVSKPVTHRWKSSVFAKLICWLLAFVLAWWCFC